MDDEAGFREFVHTRGRALTRTAYVLTGDQHLAEDLLQNVLAKVARRWDRIYTRGSPETYVRTALYREYVSWLRLRRSSEVPTADLPDVSTADFSDQTTLRLSLERAMARLSRRQRAVITLRFYDELTEAQAAGQLGCSVGTVKSQTHHALRRLRQLAPDLADLLTEERATLVSRQEGAR